MGSEIQSERAKQSQELRDLQDSYRRRKEGIEAEGQTQLKAARRENAQKLDSETATSEAAINHVRTASKEIKENERENGEQAITYERNALAKRYHNVIDQGHEQAANLNEEVVARQQQLKRDQTEIAKKESELQRKESTMSSDLQKEHSEHRTQMMNTEQAEVAASYKRTQDQKNKINVQGREEIEQLSEKNTKQLTELKNAHRGTYEKQLEVGQAQIKKQASEDAKILENQRKEFGNSQATLSDKAHKTLTQLQAEANERLNKLEDTNDKQVQAERLKGVHGMEETREYYDKNIAHVHSEGHEKLNFEQQTQEDKLRDLKIRDRAQVIDVKKVHEEEMKDLSVAQKSEEERSHMLTQQSLRQQRLEFDESYKKNSQAFAQTIKTQRDALRQSLVREKREVMQDVGKYNSKGADPFYRIADPEAKLSETDNHYIVRANIPEHEKDNVKVTVHEDKVIVHGTRRFEDQVEDESGKIATNNYQTYRQEIPLEHPVREKLLQKSYENGVLTIKIPKA